MKQVQEWGSRFETRQNCERYERCMSLSCGSGRVEEPLQRGLRGGRDPLLVVTCVSGRLSVHAAHYQHKHVKQNLPTNAIISRLSPVVPGHAVRSTQTRCLV